MKKGIWGRVLVVTMFCFLYGCNTDTDSENKAMSEKDRIEKVGDAASTIGYDGEAIDKDLREVNDLSKERDKAADDIFNE